MNWYTKVLKQYADFKGRARRREYWMFTLINVLISLLATIIDMMSGTGSAESGVGLFSTLYTLAVLIPSLAVTFRRLHDIGKSGWWVFIVLVPLIGSIWLIILLATDSTDDNRYGVRPKP
jgi:uncharacterized membrane protein YhaH (DUF805 family)